MLRLPKIFTQTLSIRISAAVVCATAILLMVSLGIAYHFSRKTIREKALDKATMALEATIQHIDNILLSVEQTTGNFYMSMMLPPSTPSNGGRLSEPDRMQAYCHDLLECNPYISSCAIAFSPYYYQEKGEFFMAHAERNPAGEVSTPYTQEKWYNEPMTSGKVGWIVPEKVNREALISFCLPLYDRSMKRVGMLAANIALKELSQIVLAAKPSPNSYCTLIDSTGLFIVHPDTNKLQHQTVFAQIKEDTDSTVRKAAEAMLSGGTDYRFFRLDGKDCYVFYKPFKRQSVRERIMNDLGWSAGVVYPEDDIFGDYNDLIYYVLGIAVVSIVLLFVSCRMVTRRKLLPLITLTKGAQRIADGNYNEPVPDARQKDEIGRLQYHFQQMQQSLAVHMSDLDKLSATLDEKSKMLDESYQKVKDTDQIKTAFLHNMTNNMIAPAATVRKDVQALCDSKQKMTEEELDHLVDEIQQQGTDITKLLNDLLAMAESNAAEGLNEE